MTFRQQAMQLITEICHVDPTAVAWCIPVSPQNSGYGKLFHATAPTRLTASDCNDTRREGRCWHLQAEPPPGFCEPRSV